MKKALIAGSASAVLAAMPVLGAFAVNAGTPLVDEFSFNINPKCQFSRLITTENETSDYSHPTTVTDGSWGATSAQATASDTFTITAAADGTTRSMGKSAFNVQCYGTNGYEVNAAVNNLTRVAGAGDSQVVIPAVLSTSGNAGSYWTVSNVKNESTVYYDGTTNNKTVASSDIPTINSGQNFVMEYGLYLADGQDSGTYRGSVVYTLTDKTPSANGGTVTGS